MKKYNPLQTDNFSVLLNQEEKNTLAEYSNQIMTFIRDHSSENESIKITKNCHLLILHSRSINQISYSRLKEKREFVSNMLQKLAVEQSKSTLVGSRSLLLPVWTSPEGRLDALNSQDILEPVSKIKIGTSTAYRGGLLTPLEALAYIEERLIRSSNSYENNIRNSQYKRAKASQEKISTLNKSLDFLQRAITKYGKKELVVRLRSGTGTKFTFKTESGISWQDTPARILMVYATKIYKIEDFNQRERGSSLVSIGYAGGIELYVRK
ncbi:hypothetical protein HWA77_17000 [Photobacterium damselae subsp. damselae]|uniref:Uncharacterized protein n=1 Tax=Photobacterium damselae subsp. damselae TaxID=85581 RepID=A0A850R0I4_PHODD|nr:hypothetical protein [Photobacterium damselae subsp. damselae]